MRGLTLPGSLLYTCEHSTSRGHHRVRWKFIARDLNYPCSSAALLCQRKRVAYMHCNIMKIAIWGCKLFTVHGESPCAARVPFSPACCCTFYMHCQGPFGTDPLTVHSQATGQTCPYLLELLWCQLGVCGLLAAGSRGQLLLQLLCHILRLAIFPAATQAKLVSVPGTTGCRRNSAC
jgi:hypothetical protein